jgi:hypothetical protein
MLLWLAKYQPLNIIINTNTQLAPPFFHAWQVANVQLSHVAHPS